MKKSDAVAYFGNPTKLARALDITPQSVYQWGEFVPKGQAAILQLITKGKLKAVDKRLLKQAS